MPARWSMSRASPSGLQRANGSPPHLRSGDFAAFRRMEISPVAILRDAARDARLIRIRKEALLGEVPGAPGRRRHRARQQRLQAVRSHQHVERGGRGAAGRGDVLAQRGGACSERCSNSPEPATVSRASRVASSAGRPASTPARASSSASRKT